MSDLEDLFAYVWARHTARMGGLTDAEWAWRPTADPDLGLRWRLDHVASLLAEPRNATVLGVGVPDASVTPAPSATEARGSGEKAWRHWLSCLRAADLSAPIGVGPYADGSRLSVALHVADELIHHTAEAALLRDLYAVRSTAARGPAS